jgi:glycine cleavage system H protein
VLNSDPYTAGWMIKIKIADASEIDSLMSADDYKNHIGQ